MATAKTQTVAVRVSTQVAEAMKADATELGITPGALLRRMLEKRYASSRNARKSNDAARNEHEDGGVW